MRYALFFKCTSLITPPCVKTAFLTARKRSSSLLKGHLPREQRPLPKGDPNCETLRKRCEHLCP